MFDDNSNFIDPRLIPPPINDARNRALISAIGDELSEFDRGDLLIQDALSVDAKWLPEMIVSRAMTEFVTPGLREDLLRNLLDQAEEIHALSGTLPGIRRALSALKVSVQWTQWFEEAPKAAHDTHKAKVFFSELLAEDHYMADQWHRNVVQKLIDATKRWSQDVTVTFGVQTEVTHFVGAFSASGSRYTAGLPREAPPENPAIYFIAATSVNSGTFQAGLEA